ncbi:hypothetical protein GIB67_025316 [Kingdonia uniflora]|uniref:Exostosin GT47 domain-containing protein n=1 Tax=Kingdonia uniflora TaxID=39325 RepID=A0A7J7NBU7_9MAGN|nr:hypothetical protein GIB67_025316 [Kingdonia uniflora]
MEVPLYFQKLCRADARRLLLVMGLIAFSVLVVQFYLVPYGSLLLSLFPSSISPLLGKTSFTSVDSSRNVVVGSFSPSSDSTSNDLSPAPEPVTSTKAAMKPEQISPLGIAPLLGKNSLPSIDSSHNMIVGSFPPLSDSTSNDLSPVPEPVTSIGAATNPEQISPFRLENVEKSYNGSTSEKIEKPLEQVNKTENNFSPETQHEEDEGLNLEKVENRGTGFLAPPPASPPVVSLASPVLSKERDTNFSTSGITTNSSISTVNEKAPDVLPKSEKPDIFKSSPATTSNPVKKGWWELPPASVTSISEMSHLLLQTRASSLSMKPHWSSERDEEILSAKSQIENAPIVRNDRELYAPLFRNVSTFKRSYELMERMLKVYIYKEGNRPIFHQPVLKGIYASEGWFMKHMQTKNRFLVSNPNKAHLFYMPFSTRLLEERLYVPNSHSRKNLIEHLKNYLDIISAKYPFWNRTDGSDHFLVACHDWAPAETSDYMNNCVRAMCNADVNAGFKIGKDVSLPETNVRVAKDPLRDLGGKSPSKREVLAFFAGKMHGYLRPILLHYWENKDPDMKIFNQLPRGKAGKQLYINYMRSSKYCICAKGYEVNSPRVVEAIFYECVPVIISDNYVPPFFEVLNWKSFTVFIPEKDLPNLKNILVSIPDKKYLKLQMGVRRVQQHFIWHTTPVKYDIFHMILHSIWYNRVFQINPR